MHPRIAVIGGGAAGFMAAISVKTHRPETDVLLLEKSGKRLAKVRISGGGRCNLTHACPEPRKLARHYPRGEAFLRKVFTAWGQPEAIHWFEQQGVKLKTEADGRMFPTSDDSRTVIEALSGAADALGVCVRMNCGVSRLERIGDAWLLDTSQGQVQVDRVVVASGGSPKAEGLEWLRALGHEVVAPVPSLFTFNLSDKGIRELMGVVAPNARLRIEGTALESTGPLLVTHWGFSGPAVLRLSAFGARILHERDYAYTVRVNWDSKLKEDAARTLLLGEAATHPRRQLANAAGFGLPARLWAFLVQRSGLPLDKPLGELGTRQQSRLFDVLTNDRYAAQGKTTFKEEFVTAGGISLAQVDPLTLRSTLQPHLHFAGEVLDIDGITGGFNFQAAWSTGWLAGRAAAQGA
ncbi:MAG: NAD(P)/FAD-dependent oxidoreductase [Flavobacteriales bacterium]|nr:NAD(P)/FAD-dependent oxidoreductase [Flavobacteriales bacterium]